ncbi:hypothetical protein KIPB_011750, partial [Kipferlia bialata]|eukprot:g11750.t1
MSQPLFPKHQRGSQAVMSIQNIIDGLEGDKAQSKLHGISHLRLLSSRANPDQALALLRTKGFLDLVIHLIGDASTTEIDKRCRLYALHTLTYHVLKAPVIDEVILAHPRLLPALTSVLKDSSAPTPPSVAAIRVLDFLCVHKPNRTVIGFFTLEDEDKTSMLDLL